MVSPCKKKKGKVPNEPPKNGLGSRRLRSSKPLSDKKFYLDIKNHTSLRQIETKLTSLGARLELFLVKDVDYVVTDRDDYPRNSRQLSVVTPSPFCSVSPAATNSPTDGVISKRTRSRAEAMLERVRQQPQKNTVDILDNASAWHIPIYSLSKFLVWLEKLINRGKKSSSTRELRGHFLKIETGGGRPDFRQFRDWPHITFSEDQHAAFHNPAPLSRHDPQRMTRKVGKTVKDGSSSTRGGNGYCEICRIHYDQLDSHITSSQHTKLVTDPAQYSQLDSLISHHDLGNVSSVRKSLRLVKSPSVEMGMKHSSPPPPTLNGHVTRSKSDKALCNGISPMEKKKKDIKANSGSEKDHPKERERESKEREVTKDEDRIVLSLRSSVRGEDKSSPGLRSLPKEEDKLNLGRRPTSRDDEKPYLGLKSSFREEERGLRTTPKDEEKHSLGLRSANREEDKRISTPRDEEKRYHGLRSASRDEDKGHLGLRSASKDEEKLYPTLRSASREESKGYHTLRSSSRDEPFLFPKAVSREEEKGHHHLRSTSRDEDKVHPTLRSGYREEEKGYGLRTGYREEDKSLWSGSRDKDKGPSLRSGARDEDKGHHSLRSSSRDDDRGHILRSGSRDEDKGHGLRSGYREEDKGRGLRSTYRDEDKGHGIRLGHREEDKGHGLRSGSREEDKGHSLRSGSREEDKGHVLRSGSRDEDKVHGLRSGYREEDKVHGLRSVSREDDKGHHGLRSGSREEEKGPGLRPGSREDDKGHHGLRSVSRDEDRGNGHHRGLRSVSRDEDKGLSGLRSGSREEDKDHHGLRSGSRDDDKGHRHHHGLYSGSREEDKGNHSKRPGSRGEGHNNQQSETPDKDKVHHSLRTGSRDEDRRHFAQQSTCLNDDKSYQGQHSTSREEKKGAQTEYSLPCSEGVFPGLRSTARSDDRTNQYSKHDEDKVNSVPRSSKSSTKQATPKRNRVARKRLSVEEKLIEDNKSYYKVEVLNSKLRSTGYFISQKQLEARVNGTDSQVNGSLEKPEEKEIKEPVVVRFKKVRKTQLSVLSDEAENFMFGDLTRKEMEAKEESSDSSEESGRNADTDSSSEEETPRKKKRRKLFTPPGSSSPKIRYQNLLTPSSLADDNSDDDEVEFNLEDLKFGFERPPVIESWMDSYKPTEQESEFYFPHYHEYPRTLLPFEYPISERLKLLQSRKVAGFGKRRDRLSRVIEDGKPRKSPRCHASTLAIMSSLMRRRPIRECTNNIDFTYEEESRSSFPETVESSSSASEIRQFSVCSDPSSLPVDPSGDAYAIAFARLACGETTTFQVAPGPCLPVDPALFNDPPSPITMVPSPGLDVPLSGLLETVPPVQLEHRLLDFEFRFPLDQDSGSECSDLIGFAEDGRGISGRRRKRKRNLTGWPLGKPRKKVIKLKEEETLPVIKCEPCEIKLEPLGEDMLNGEFPAYRDGSSFGDEGVTLPVIPLKRGRGRPRKYPLLIPPSSFSSPMASPRTSPKKKTLQRFTIGPMHSCIK